MPDSVVSAAVSSLERDKMPLMPVKREKEMAAITYQLRAACRDPALEMERAFDCEVLLSKSNSLSILQNQKCSRHAWRFLF